MKIPRIANAVGQIDDDLVAAAVSEKCKKKPWRKWVAVAACFGVMVIAAAVILPSFFGEDVVVPGEHTDRYKDFTIQSGEYGIVWPWEYKTVYEKYHSIDMDGREFAGRGSELSADCIGGQLGSCQATGYDDYSEHIYHETFDVYEIEGVSPEELVAVNMDGRYYVFIAEASKENGPPATFGEVLERYSLPRLVPLSRFSFEGNGIESNYHVLNDDAYIWSVLQECTDAKATDPLGWHETRGGFVSFTVTSEALGIYKRAMYVTESGYLWTNSFDIEYLYDIGEEAAGKIIQYAKENSVEGEYEPYRNTVAGKITKITDGYLLIDDSILCKDPADGITYKVLLNDIRISRYIDRAVVSVGSTVLVTYEGNMDENTIDRAISLSEGIISDGDLLIPE